MAFPNEQRPRTDAKNRSTVRSDGSLRGRSMNGWMIAGLVMAVVLLAVVFLLPNRNNNTAMNTTSGPGSTMNSGSTAKDPARAPASTTGSGTTSPTAPTTTR